MAKVRPNVASKKKTESQSVAPPEAPPAEKKEPKRIAHPDLLTDDEGQPTAKIKEIPKDYDRTKHLPLRRRDFEDEAKWFDMRANEFDVKAFAHRKMAEEFRTLGSAKDRAKARRLVSMQKQMADLRKTLEDEGVDVDALLAIDG